MIDLRSDTVTKPSAAMLNAMMEAKVGDDVFKQDPTVNELEASLADLFGKEAALFFPSGTMANQTAIKLHTNPGDELICDKWGHVFLYEAGGVAFNSGVSCNLIDGNRGMITAEQVEKAIQANVHHVTLSKDVFDLMGYNERMPVSSRISLMAASNGDSPSSIPPFGKLQEPSFS